MLDSLATSAIGASITLYSLLICTGASLVLGLGVAAVHMYKNHSSKGFVVTLALLPAIVQIVIMMVNGNVGTGVAVAGAFSLVRFRSVPGSARDIVSIFFAMAIGLATGMGYIFFAALFLIIIGIASVVLFASPFGESKASRRTLKITIPESMDYETLFDDIFAEHLTAVELDRVKTTTMGSLYELSYTVELKNPGQSKALLDDIRVRNGNLNIILSRPALKEAL